VLSPAVAAVHRLAQGVAARTTARFQLAREAYLDLVQRTEQPGATGLDESHQRYLRFGVMFGLGTIEANLGLPSALHWASELENEPLHRINSRLIRQLHALWQGRADEAALLQREIESMRLREGARQWLDGASLVGVAVVNALSDDLTQIKRTCESLEPFARRQRPWTAVLTYARAEHQRISGDLRGACTQLDALMDGLGAGQHQIWPHAAGAYVRVLTELGEAERACTVGQAYLKSGEQAGLGVMVSYVKLPLALALAQRGQTQLARQLTQEVLMGHSAIGTTGLNFVLAHETAARIALLAQDIERFEVHLGVVEAHAIEQKSRSLIARFQKLKRTGKAVQSRLRAVGHLDGNAHALLDTAMRNAVDAAERAEHILGWLVSGSGARGGILYLQQAAGLTQCAQTPDACASAALMREIEGFVSAQVQHEADNTRSLSDDDAHDLGHNVLFVDEQGDRYRAVLLTHQTEQGFVVSGAAVLIEPHAAKLMSPTALVTHASELAATHDGAELILVL
jgi:hypothetical protein